MVELYDQTQAIKTEAGNLGEEPKFDEDLVKEFDSVCFVTKQLLEIALMADYGDEIGRRKMFTLIRRLSSALPKVYTG